MGYLCDLVCEHVAVVVVRGHAESALRRPTNRPGQPVRIFRVRVRIFRVRVRIFRIRVRIMVWIIRVRVRIMVRTFRVRVRIFRVRVADDGMDNPGKGTIFRIAARIMR